MKYKTVKNQPSLGKRRRRIYEFLDTNRIGVLASTSPDNEPHGSVIYHSTTQDFDVSFLTKKGTQKYRNLKIHNHVVLVVFDPHNQSVVQVYGSAKEITDSYEINRLAAAIFVTSLKNSDVGIPPIAKLDAGEYIAFVIKPDQIRMASYSNLESSNYDEIFESIESFELNSGIS